VNDLLSALGQSQTTPGLTTDATVGQAPRLVASKTSGGSTSVHVYKVPMLCR